MPYDLRLYRWQALAVCERLADFLRTNCGLSNPCKPEPGGWTTAGLNPQVARSLARLLSQAADYAGGITK